jgi:transposase
MLGRQELNTDLFQCVTMEALVPPNHLLRRINRVMDLGFVRERVASLYSPVGRRSYDPEVVVRMWILQHLYDLSEREVCDEVTMHAGFRWFCGLSFNDDVPDQSTLVKLRTEKWAQTGVWEELLAATVRWCEAAGACRPGDRKGVDGTQISARAATVSLEAIPAPLCLVETDAPDDGADP